MKKYTINLGLFDKDTKTQKFSTIDAFKVAAEIATEEVGGATITEGTGVYTHKDGTQVIEPSLVITILDFGELTDEKVRGLRNRLLLFFNQEEVLLTREEVATL